MKGRIARLPQAHDAAKGQRVNGGRKLTYWRRPKIDPPGGSAGWSVGVVGGHSPEVAVLQSIAVSFEGDDSGVVDEPVDHGGGDDEVAEHLPQRPKGLFLVTIIEARTT